MSALQNTYDLKIAAGPHRFGSFIVGTPTVYKTAEAARKALTDIICRPLHTPQEAKSGTQRWQIVAKLITNDKDCFLSFIGQKYNLLAVAGKRIVIEYQTSGDSLDSFIAVVKA